MIIFKELKFKNLFTYGNQFTTINLNKSQATLVMGNNGVGKSVMCDALCFVLFGKAFRDNVTKKELLNFKNKKEGFVELTFSSNEDNYLIRRGISPDLFEIYKDDVLIDQDSTVKLYQNMLETQIIKINYNTFKQIIVIGEDSYKPFMKLDAKKRREFVESVLSLQVFRLMSEKQKNDITNLNKELIQLDKQIEINKLITDKNLKTVESFKNIENDESLQSRIELLRSEILSVTDNLLELKKQNLDKHVLSDLEAQIRDFDKKGYLVTSDGKSIKETLKIVLENDKCPTCKQQITESFKNSFSEVSNEQLKVLRIELTNIRKQLVELNNKKQGLIDDNDEIEIRKTIINKESNRLDILNRELELKQENNSSKYDKEIDKLINENLELSHKTIELEEQRVELLSKIDICTSAGLVLKDNGIRSHIINRYVPLINDIMAKYISELGLPLTFELDSEFNDYVALRGINKVTYAALSVGQKLRVDIAMLLTWREIAKQQGMIHTNLIIFDDIVGGSIDANGIEAFSEIILLLKDNNIFIIDPLPTRLMDKIHARIEVEYKNGFACIAD